MRWVPILLVAVAGFFGWSRTDERAVARDITQMAARNPSGFVSVVMPANAPARTVWLFAPQNRPKEAAAQAAGPGAGRVATYHRFMHEPLIPLHEDDMTFTAVRAQGPGGQNVHKVSSAVHLRYDLRTAALPDDVRERLLALRDHRITAEGVVVIKAQAHRSQALNRAEAIERLQALVDSVARPRRARRATRPSAAARRQRLQHKAERGALKRLRGRVSGSE